MTVTLPYPPSANRYWRKTKFGRIYVSDEAKQFRRSAGLIARAAGIREVSGEVAVTLKFFRPDLRGDIDNRVKVCLDALNGIAWADDKQVGALNCTRDLDRKNPRVEVEIVARCERREVEVPK